MQPLRIAVLTPESRVSAGYFYRVEVPFFSAARSNRVRLLFPGDGGLSLDDVLARADAVFVQRMLSVPGWDVPRLVQTLRRARIPLVYELDDDLTNLPATNPRKAFWDARQDDVRRLVAEADLVVVSTEALRERFGRENANLHVYPNHLDLAVLAAHGVAHRPPTPEGSPIRVGYAGSATHAADLRLLEGVLAELAALPPYTATVRHGSTGFLAALPEEWAAGVERLVTDAPLRRAMAEAAWAACFGPEGRRRLEADRAAYLARLEDLVNRR